jgi:uncharacterized membrane protein YvlD (DUF360 family)
VDRRHISGGNVVIDLLVKVLINAVGVYAAIQIVPQIKFPAAEDLSTLGDNWWKLLAVALISLGLFSLVLNALLLLLVAFVSDQVSLGFSIDKFPPEFTADAFIGALFGSIIISIVSTLLGMVNTGRKVVV